ncbi:MAG TPA: dihydroorotate dehydrogenase electron transfer subunit [Tissierellia bacterium]|nr:dihydroorotate dehydrogenase electron transfer subunit [Tissierellia bacterium]
MTYEATVIDQERLTADVFVLTLDCPAIAKEAEPGQFVQVKTSNLLRRPFAVMDLDRAKGTIRLGIHQVGKGTNELSQKRPGDTLSLLGPFGTGFSLAEAKRVIVVGGGSGIFPLLHLAKQAKRQALPLTSILGFQSRERSFLADDFKDLSDDLILSSESGDMGLTGYVTQGLQAYLEDLSEPTSSQTILYSCGPIAMLEAVVSLAKAHHIKSYVSLEVRMGCGYGVCRGCPVDVYKGDTIERVRCCVEGPVFSGETVVFDSLRGEV